MDQSASSTAGGIPQARPRSPVVTATPSNNHTDSDDGDDKTPDVITSSESPDYISSLPDDCLARVFLSLSSGDRKHCSLVCRRWLLVERQYHRRLSLNSRLINSLVSTSIPSILTRFDALTTLILELDHTSISITDELFVSISLRCRCLTRLKLRGCSEITDAGIAGFTKNCKNLTRVSFGSCNFGPKGMNSVLNNCPSLEELSIKRLNSGNISAAEAEPIDHGAAAASIRAISLRELHHGLCFLPLIIGAKNLKSLKLSRCLVDWDKLLDSVGDWGHNLRELHLERVEVSGAGIAAISNCPNLDKLHLIQTPVCTNDGVKTISRHCKHLKELHIGSWFAEKITDEGLIAVAQNCTNLEELVLIGVNPSGKSLEELGTNCGNLERLALCESETVGDEEVSCIARKCNALKKLCIDSCPVSDDGLGELACGCPNLIMVKVKKCRKVSAYGGDWLKGSRKSVTVNLDASLVRRKLSFD